MNTNNLQSVLNSGDYSLMAKTAKELGLFTGQAPNKSKLAAMIDQYLTDHVDIDGVADTDSTSEEANTPSAGVESDNGDLPEVTAKFTPKATGYIGGQAEFYYWPEFNVYAQNVAGQPVEPKFDSTMWETMKGVLPKAEALKVNVVKAAQKAIEAVKYTYTVTVRFDGLTFESTDPDLQATDLTLSTINSLLEDCGQETMSEGRVRFNLIRGKVKKSGSSRSTAGEGSGFYTASDRSELRPLNVVQKQILQAAASVNGCPLSDHAKYGRQDSVKLGNVCIEFKKKGYGDAIKRVNGAIYFDAGAMYEGYTLADSGI